MARTIICCSLLILCSCTPTSTQSSSEVNGNIVSSAKPCTESVKSVDVQPKKLPQSPKNRELYAIELETLIRLHRDINKVPEYMEFVYNTLTSKHMFFLESHNSSTSKHLNLIPFFQKCCTEELRASQYLSYGSCLDRIFSRVISNQDPVAKDLLSLSKGILLELSPKGRKGWCEYIDSEWATFNH